MYFFRVMLSYKMQNWLKFVLFFYKSGVICPIDILLKVLENLKIVL